MAAAMDVDDSGADGDLEVPTGSGEKGGKKRFEVKKVCIRKIMKHYWIYSCYKKYEEVPFFVKF